MSSNSLIAPNALNLFCTYIINERTRKFELNLWPKCFVTVFESKSKVDKTNSNYCPKMRTLVNNILVVCDTNCDAHNFSRM